MSAKYNADKIKILEGLEAVRKRPAMYIGDTAKRGLHHMVFEVVDNSIDEVLSGDCDKINVFINEDQSVTVIDNGRGIPVDMHPTEKRPALEVVMTKLHAGGKFDNKSYQMSGGLHGVGVSVVNALSVWLEATVYRNGNIYKQRFERGFPIGEMEIIGTAKKTGTEIRFMPDNQIFPETDFSFDILSERIRELAFLNSGVFIEIKDLRDTTGEKWHKFKFKGGITEFVSYLDENKVPLHKIIHIQTSREKIQADIALQYNTSFTSNLFSFANNIRTKEGGTHLIGFKSALTREINDYAKKSKMLKNLDAI